MEAFCSDCRIPLCMGCILTNKHTSHCIISLVDANKSLKKSVAEKFASNVTDGMTVIQSLGKALSLKLDS